MQIEIKNRFTGTIILCGEYESVRDCLQKNSSADLHSADLHSADLSGADLHSADLSSADLRYANLHSADLHSADLSGADLHSADLHSADLHSADLRYANLRYADLRYANLSGADLHSADLHSADLRSANLSETILDPTNKPNCNIDGFEKIDDIWVYGYRTRATSAAGRILQDDRIYGTEVFSTADTECHPGWYLWPTLQHSIEFTGQGPYIKVKARICDMHKAGSKWRSRAIWVIGDAQ